MKEYSLGTELKQKNRNSVYHLIHKLRCIPRQRIVSELGLSLPTVTQNLNDLIDEGLLCEKGSFGNTGGRRAKGYDIVPDARAAVGVDINKNHYSVVVLDLLGQKMASSRVFTKFENTDAYYETIGKAVDAAISEAGVSSENILGVGIAIQGIVNADNTVISYGEIQGITRERIERIGKYINYPKKLFHDSDMAAFAEFWHNQEGKETVYLSLSTNLGGAIVQSQQANHTGAFGKARIEHMTIVPDGKPCYCGQFGCADAYCSTTVLTDMMPDGRLQSFFKALKECDKHICAAWDEYLDKLAIVINNARIMYDCDVVLGGYMGEYLDEYLDELKRRAYSRNSFDKSIDYLQLCHVKSEPVCVGAALQYVEQFISSV